VNGWLLDTNVIAEIRGARPEPEVASWFNSQPEHALFLSILTVAEYHKGIAKLAPGDKRRLRIQASVASLQTRFSGRVLSLSDEIALRWGEISGQVKRLTGQFPKVIDSLLAATAIEHNLYLATRNVVDVAHSGAAIFNPWKDDPAHFPL
jgi:predicted nucleic acid-binding protein